ncbi:MAG: hypothetical protein WDN69_04575 [Aliidongia sp.]
MRAALAASLVASLWLGTPLAEAEDIAASPPRELSVTIYRAPGGDAERIAQQSGGHGGFALITETRDVTIRSASTACASKAWPKASRPRTALVTGLPAGIIEKNRDARRLSPSSLLRTSVGKQGHAAAHRSQDRAGYAQPRHDQIGAGRSGRVRDGGWRRDLELLGAAGSLQLRGGR